MDYYAKRCPALVGCQSCHVQSIMPTGFLRLPRRKGVHALWRDHLLLDISVSGQRKGKRGGAYANPRRPLGNSGGRWARPRD
jgi:hypothetical protein